MTVTKYLYGVSIEHFARMYDREATEERIKLANKLIADLFEVDLMNRDDIRIRAIFRAISHNEKRMEEYE